MEISQKSRLFLALVIVVINSGCAEIIEGSRQTILINTAPQGASCTITSNGRVTNTLENTPGSVVIDKTHYDLLIRCSRPGYGVGEIRDKSGLAAASLADIPFGLVGVVGGLTDGISGASNKYDTPVLITLQRP